MKANVSVDAELTLYALDSSFSFDAIKLGCSIVDIEGLHVIMRPWKGF